VIKIIAMVESTSAESEALPRGGIGVHEGAAEVPVAEPTTRDFQFESSLRERAARGTLVNSAFYVGLSGLALLRGFILAALVSTTEYGLWGVLVVAIGTLLSLKQVGINDKYIEQDEPDQEAAFQKAFTLDLGITLIAVAAVAVLMPILMIVYDTESLLGAGFVVLLAFVAAPFQAPLWVFYRRMEFVRQRLLQAVDPVVAFVVKIVLAALGAGYWSFVIGFTGGVVCSAVAAVAASPYRLRLRFHRGTAKRYLTFSWPLFVASGSSLVIAQSAILTSRWDLGLAAAGALVLASQITIFTDRVDQVVTGTLYPAICAVKDRRDVLFESFVKSNRLALMWAVPFGLALTLFSADLVAFAIGEKWRDAVPVLEIFGIVAAVNHVGFNWTAYLRARADTKPIAAAHVAGMVTFLAVGVPGLIVLGLPGFAVGVAAQTVVGLALRTHYLRRLFHGFRFLERAFRAFLPTLPAVVAVLVLRVTGPETRTVEWVLMELVVYLEVTLLATWYFERPLLREVAGYLRGRRPEPSMRAASQGRLLSADT
jgi:O-antigen/teichoic acid export membrane protein